MMRTKACSFGSIAQARLDVLIPQALREILLPLVSEVSKLPAEKKTIRKSPGRIQTLTAQKQRLTDIFQLGKIALQEYVKRCDALDAEMQKLTTTNVEQEVKPDLRADMIKILPEIWLKMGWEDKRQLLAYTIDRIYVTSGTNPIIEVHSRFSKSPVAIHYTR
jgi:hypothetical protein